MSQLQQQQQQDEVDQGAMAQPEISENDKIGQKIRKCYARIASSINPVGTVVDQMIAKEIVTFDKASKIYRMETNSERIFELIGKVITGLGGHPEGFIVFREALKNEYPWMVNIIDATPDEKHTSDGREEQLKLEQHNTELKTAVVSKLSVIHGSVDPKGHIMDLLYQESILTWGNMVELMKLPDQDERIRELMKMLAQSRNLKTYITFLESLDKDYEWVVRQINEACKVDYK